MVRLSDIQRVLPGALRLGEADPEIRGIDYDSREVGPGDLFVCVRGFKTDGRQYLPDAAQRGAAAALLERPAQADCGIPTLVVPSAREAMARAATAFYGYPSRELALVGVTGTNGKTTTTYLVESICRVAGWKTGIIGTVGCRIGSEPLPAERTTPEAPDLQGLLRQMVNAGVRSAAMEVSSHALSLQRTLGCEFDVGVFTNLTQDHFDFHRDIEDYFAAKSMLFQSYPRASGKLFTAVINGDDPYGRRLAAMAAGCVVTYGVSSECDLRATDIDATARSLCFTLAAGGERHHVRMRLGGLFNVANALAAAGAARALGLDWPAVARGLGEATGVPGRFESVEAGQDYAVIVDYAHSPDGLENLLRSARALSPRRLLVVFGCGGDRDRTKRPLMGGIAARLADRIFITSDNPRSEEPAAILEEILAGVPERARPATSLDADRRASIHAAVAEAKPGDVVLIAGKGHETYQIFATETIHFDDREVAREAIDRKKNR
jgi:UDP-N-acetylmuramoyl-L-alanyl-D-glutamate--2,6-diaminopimelate ligase